MSPQVHVESRALCTDNFEIPATTKTSEQITKTFVSFKLLLYKPTQ